MLLVGNTGSEIESAADLLQAPQTFELQRDVENVFRSADKAAVAGLININAAIAEISPPQLSIHNPEPPGGIEISARHQAPKHLPMRVEGVNKSAARARDIILSFGVLFRVGDNHATVKITNSERRIPCWNIRVRNGNPVWRTKFSLYVSTWPE